MHAPGRAQRPARPRSSGGAHVSSTGSRTRLDPRTRARRRDARAAAIDLVGATSATFVWQPASGPVSGYVVYQLCEATGQTQKSSVITNQVTLSAQPCSAFSVQVAAYGVGGLAQTGPLSTPSDVVRFLPAPPPPSPAPAPSARPRFLRPAVRPRCRPAGLDFVADGRTDVLLHLPSDGSLQLWSLRRATRSLVLAASLPAFPTGGARGRVAGTMTATAFRICSASITGRSSSG